MSLSLFYWIKKVIIAAIIVKIKSPLEMYVIYFPTDEGPGLGGDGFKEEHGTLTEFFILPPVKIKQLPQFCSTFILPLEFIEFTSTFDM